MNNSLSAHILVDADSCPVKQEIYKVAIRHQARVCIVANNYLTVPENPLFRRVQTGSDFDAADDFIAGEAGPRSIVITSDILLADRCLKSGAVVIAHNGVPFTPNSIGGAIATRAIMEDLRAGGEQVGGARPFDKKDRSRFLSALHDSLVRLKQV